MIFPREWQIPEFRPIELFPKKNKYAVCVFTLNESIRFQQQIQDMVPLTARYDIIIADGGSTDGSTEIEFLLANRVNSLIIKTGAGKLSSQMRMAFAYSLLRGYEGIITIDGNHKDETSAVDLFSDAFERGMDHIQGSRFIPGGEEINTPLMRVLAIRLIHAPIISLAAGYRYTDTTNGFRGYSARFLRDPRVAPFRDIFTTYELHYYLSIRAAKLGYNITEVPVVRRYPKSGKIPTKISPIKGNLSILKVLILSAIGWYNP